MAIKTLSHLLLQVSDLDEAERFYTGVLGMGVRDRTPLRDGRPLLVTRHGLGLTVFPAGAEARAKTVDHIAFRVADLAPVIERLKEAGVAFEGPMPTPYGQSIYFRDPDGNRIECHDESGGA